MHSESVSSAVLRQNDESTRAKFCCFPNFNNRYMAAPRASCEPTKECLLLLLSDF